ncbi:hypothetical protein Tco_0299916 [Tanacetum coccineum]
MSRMDDDLFTYEVEVANIPCDSNKDNDSEQRMSHEADDDMGYGPSDVAFTEWLGLIFFNYKTMYHYTKKALWIYWIRGDDEVELTDEEFSDDEDEVAEVFRIDTNIFYFEMPIDVPWVDEKPWTNKHYCKPFNYKTRCSEWPTCSWKNDGYCNGGNLPGAYIVGNSLYYQDYECYDALIDYELKEQALRNKAISDDESSNDVITEYLVNISKRRAFWSLNEDILKITILTTNMPYPSRKIRRIHVCTHQRPQRNQVQYAVSSEDQYADSNRTTRSHPEASRRRHPDAANGSVDGRKLYDVKVLVDASDVDRVYEVSNPLRSFTTKHESIACLTDADCSFQLATADQVFGNFMGNLPRVLGLTDVVRTRGRTSSASTNSGLQAADALNSKINVDVVFDGAFGGVRDKEVIVGEGVVVISSSLDMLTNSCLGRIMVSLIFLEGLDEEAFVEFMV